MVWGAVSTAGLISLERTSPKIDGDDCLKMVTGKPLDRIRKKCGPSPMFIQDNPSPQKRTNALFSPLREYFPIGPT
jgi:hypothetical protein